MTPVFAHETQPAYIKVLDIAADVHHLLGRPTPLSGLGGQINQATIDLSVRIADALQNPSSSERARKTAQASQSAGTLAALLDLLALREEADESDILAIKQKLAALADELNTISKSLAAHKQLRQRVR